jgi:amino acid permease
MLMGRKSIFWISTIIFVQSLGLISIYFIVFSNISQSLISQTFFEGKNENIFCKKEFYVIILALGLFPLVIRKNLEELKIASLILFIGVASFLFIIAG